MDLALKLLPAAAILLTLAASDVLADQWSKTFKMTGPPELRVEVEDSPITVTGEDRQDIEARVITAGWKISGNEVRVLDTHAGNLLELKVVTPNLGHTMGRRALRVELHVPREVNCELKAVHGRLTVTGVKGKTVLVLRAGLIDTANLDGKLEATSGEGRIRARGRFDVLTLRTGFGAIDVEALTGSRMFTEWRISSDGGNVTVALPADFGADLNARSDAGRIAVDVPFAVTGTRDPSNLQAKLNNGGEELVIRTSGGLIKVRQK